MWEKNHKCFAVVVNLTVWKLEPFVGWLFLIIFANLIGDLWCAFALLWKTAHNVMRSFKWNRMRFVNHYFHTNCGNGFSTSPVETRPRWNQLVLLHSHRTTPQSVSLHRFTAHLAWIYGSRCGKENHHYRRNLRNLWCTDSGKTMFA